MELKGQRKTRPGLRATLLERSGHNRNKRQFDFLYRKAKKLQELDKQIFDTAGDDRIEFEMVAAQEGEEKRSHQSCAQPQNDTAAPASPSSDDALTVAQGNAIDTVSPPATDRRPAFSAICRSVGRGTAGTAADDHPVIPHARALVRGIVVVALWRNITFVARVGDRI